MQQKQKRTFRNEPFVFGSVLLNAIVLEQGLVCSAGWYTMLAFSIPLLAISLIVLKGRQW
jgi:hypothetical protein